MLTECTIQRTGSKMIKGIGYGENRLECVLERFKGY
ncbi:hypothetical protein [Pectobacterium phage Wc4-1]|uniref:Uncharacterized protein n=1 Tax=Pectobacterium phage Wc4 TaxID=2652428 RepID=A0A5P8D635_9CAUD|nr:hypothetical protein [Pectobacterium phage Wc4]QFP93924.1 hypothetical protein [Pectobacterium phage Wc4-1]